MNIIIIINEKCTVDEAINYLIDDFEKNKYLINDNKEFIKKSLKKSESILKENEKISKIVLDSLNNFFNKEKTIISDDEDFDKIHYYIETATEKIERK